MQSHRSSRLFLAYAAASGLALLAFAAHAGLGLGGGGLDWLFNDFVYNGLIFSAAAACLLRALLVREQRLGWGLLGLGLLFWLGGDIYWTLSLADLESPPFPSLSDPFYLALYPFSYAGLLLLLRSRVRGSTLSLWLDGAIVALGVASLAAALAVGPIVEATSGDTGAIAVNLAYPLGDLVLLALVIVAIGVSGWRFDRAWALLGCGLVALAVADGIYLVQVARETYVEGTLLDVLWPATTLLVGYAAWQPVHTRERPDFHGSRVVAAPVAGAMLALGLLTYDHFARLHLPALFLTVATLFLVLIRMALAFRQNQRLLAHTREESLTDPLTGLGNRRALMADIERELGAAKPENPRAVVVFDLDGFKQYNDVFGHPAGDALLARLGERLGASVRGHGRAYRMGGDEFCTLLQPGIVRVEAIAAGGTSALTEYGHGFEVTASHGWALVPEETQDSNEALQMADERMYAQKGGRHSSASRQSRDVLLRTLRERQPDLHRHLHDVTELALAVGRSYDVSPEETDVLARAAELHDVGKVAIPDEILHKSGPLNAHELVFMRRHTLIGERILASAPALRPVARIVRSSHEQWDGEGYPDGLKGDEIPLAARIVAVCDAYDAMVSGRSYKDPMSHEDALAELRRFGGSQFDPGVVEAFCRVVSEVVAPAGVATDATRA
jgi:two-component system, cell cycle response regulator